MKSKEVKGTPRVLDLDKMPNVIDVFDDRMIGTEPRRIMDDQVKRMAKEMSDQIDAEIIEEVIGGKKSND